MGHGSMRAALIYQHATSARDRSIATALSAFVTADRQTATKPDETDEQGSSKQDGQARAPIPAARNGTTRDGGPSHDRGGSPSWLVDGAERATGIEPAWPAWKIGQRSRT